MLSYVVFATIFAVDRADMNTGCNSGDSCGCDRPSCECDHVAALCGSCCILFVMLCVSVCVLCYRV